MICHKQKICLTLSALSIDCTTKFVDVKLIKRRDTMLMDATNHHQSQHNTPTPHTHTHPRCCRLYFWDRLNDEVVYQTATYLNVCRGLAIASNLSWPIRKHHAVESA